MKDRKLLDEKYTWDFSLIYKNHNEYLKDFEDLKSLAKKSLLYKGKLNNRNDILEYFKLNSQIELIIERMSVYVSLRKELNGADVKALEDLSEFEIFLTNYSEDHSFESVELSRLEDKFIDELIKDKDFKDFNVGLKHLKEEKKYVLDETREAMMAKISSFAGFCDIFSKLDDIEIKFDKIQLDNGESVQLTNANYALYSHDQSQNVRKQANQTIHRGYKNFNLTIAENFINFLKYRDAVAGFRGFDGEMNKQLFASRIPSKVVHSLIDEVNKHLPLFYEFVEEMKKKLNLDVFYNSDVYAPLSKGVQTKYTFDEAKDIVLNALKPLGEDYQKILKTLFDKRTIDVYPTENKGGGAFSTGCYNCLPMVLLNFTGTYNDVSTIAHELGHSMHTYLSNNNQCFEKSGYDIFVAEIASTVNELLLFRYMEKNAKNEEERKFYIASFLSTFYATIFRQTMFTEFEVFVHGSVHNGKVLSYEKLNSVYGDLQKKYFGNGVKLLENAEVEWSRIPHFYRPFYVYKYATGLISACSIVSNILSRGNDYVENAYLKFLASGSSKNPIDILKLAEVDIQNQETYNKSFTFFDLYLKEFKRLK